MPIRARTRWLGRNWNQAGLSGFPPSLTLLLTANQGADLTHFYKLFSTLTLGTAAIWGQNLESISINALANPDAATSPPAIRKTPRFDKWRRTYNLSVIALGAATAADMASSFKFSHDGQRERNAFLASSNGAYGIKGAAIEAGVVGASLLAQHYFVKRHPGLRIPFAISNYAIAGFQVFNVRHNTNYY